MAPNNEAEFPMRIAVDLDDVLADLVSCLLSTHREMTGEQLTREQAVRWDVFPIEVHDRVRYGGGYSRLAPLPGAREFLSWLKPEHQVFIVTYRGAPARDVTLEWLDRHVPGLYDEVHLTGGGKVDVCRELAVELIVDDSCHQIPAVTAALGIPGILIETPMNRHVQETELIRRARGLTEARVVIEEIAARVV